MKKRLLLQVLALFGVVGAYAASVGSYIYTADSKFKVTGENILTNGNFAELTSGWTTTTLTDVDMTKWTIETGAGANGENVLQSATIDGTDLARSIALEAGKEYSISFDIKAGSAMSTNVTLASTNTILFFMNSDGSYSQTADGYRLLNEVNTFDTEWTTINDTVQVAADATALMLEIVFQNITEGTQITNFEIHEISPVYDDRVGWRAVEYCKFLANNTEFAAANGTGVANGIEDFNSAIEFIESMLNDPSQCDDIATMTDAIYGLNEQKTVFLDANSADMSVAYTSWEDTATKYQKATSIGAWTLIGGRWFHMNSSSDTQDNIYSTIQASFDLVNASATLTQTFTPGRYMFAVDMKGYYFTGTASSVRYTPNYESDFYGATIFANGDTTAVDTLTTRYYTTVTKFFDAPEGDNNVSVGAAWTIPEDMVGKKLGGCWFLSNHELRMLGTTADEQYSLLCAKNIQEQQRALEGYVEILDSLYNEASYPWGKAALLDSINLVKERLAESYTKVDKDGNVLDVTATYDESGKIVPKSVYYSQLVTYNSYANTARSNYISTNKPYTTLVADVETCKASLADEVYAGASASARTNLQNKVDEAEKLIAAVTSEPDETFTTLDTELMTAKAKFEASAATYSNPSSLDIANPFFASNVNSWTLTANNTSKEKFKKSSNDSYDNGTCAQVWRGATASPNSKLVQKLTMPETGIYEYRASAHALNETKAYDMYMATITVDELTNESDTTYNNSTIKLFFGLTGAPDSVMVHSRNIAWSGSNQVDGYVASKYSVFFIPNEGDLAEFGMSSFTQTDKQGANAYGFGDNYIYYYGTDYQSVMTGVKDELEAEIKTGKTLLADTANNAGILETGRVYIVNRLKKAVNEGETALATTMPGTSDKEAVIAYCKALANAKWAIKAQEKTFSAVMTGINTILAGDDAAKAAVKGVYTLSGVKVAADAQGLKALPKGLYIINGKKYIVR